MIVDCHAHIFPFLGGPSGYETTEEHLRWLQLYIVGHGQPVKEFATDRVVKDPGLASIPIEGPQSLNDVSFRIGRNGRFLWSSGGQRSLYPFHAAIAPRQRVTGGLPSRGDGICRRRHGRAAERPPIRRPRRVLQ